MTNALITLTIDEAQTITGGSNAGEAAHGAGYSAGQALGEYYNCCVAVATDYIEAIANMMP